uniref:GST N-terminal domain-containing protein n=2 Tax=Lotharella oceanica TaxID=641309 RepID=A0A7S2U1L2_9EUKA|mmetsp:Transcript_5499/g.10900  ORF Transcript_5499/g.10900 Transcript_5499/m.10900 type:complete len:222 (+) Transcript_5499:643-1308(+)|eukprot:CAMPEP_0170167198 /NCGR_PEP_ID=MMETSP0040_2-20121228/679_1 /TAXON_ID=641309 /ORGANISM="Lotharella oceanica, Strain CCMP622" /LENGTH=221 /DNA_ID=CAMNT_0010405155 /DNA_START=580 /DNA_END=1245 /DNA_ORIENTATION=-
MSASPTVYYWPMLGRAGAPILMMEYKKVKYEHKSEFKEIAEVCTAFGAKSDTFAPPVISWDGVTLSQSVPVALFVGEKLGLDKGYDKYKLMQYASDAADLASGVFNNMKGSPEDIKKFIEERMKKFGSNIEASIKGPFYFGEAPSSVDFFLYNALKITEIGLTGPIAAETKKDYLAGFNKIKGVLAGVEALDGVKGFKKMSFLREGYTITKELAASVAKLG